MCARYRTGKPHDDDANGGKSRAKAQPRTRVVSTATKTRASAAAKPVASAAGPATEINRFGYVAAAIAAVGGLLFGSDTASFPARSCSSKATSPSPPTMEEIVVSAVLVGAASKCRSMPRLADQKQEAQADRKAKR